MSSNFEQRHYDIGFKDKVLDNYSQSYEDGRRMGYKNAFKEAIALDLNSSCKNNMQCLRILSEWEGILTALEAYIKGKSLDEEVITELKKLKECLNDFKNNLTFVNFSGNVSPVVKDRNQNIQNLISNCKLFCQKLDWKVPSEINEL